MSVPGIGHRPQRYFQRFNRSQRVQHAIQILSFSILCFTGLIQKFSDNDTLELLIQLLGGVERIRIVHRITAIVFMLEAAYHAIELTWNFTVKRIKPTMIPNLQDARDASKMIMYFLGRSKERAHFDRFDFRQKVEYLSLIWGSIVMIVTGLMMWYPIQVTALLPGEFIPAARVAHGGEGLLAFLAIFTWHMYSAHLAPEVFPFDATMFTGTISEERMIHEHPLEYARLVAAQELEHSTAEVRHVDPRMHVGYSASPVPEPVIQSRRDDMRDYPGRTASVHQDTLVAQVACNDEEELELEEIDYIDDDFFDAPTGVYTYHPRQS